MMIRTSHSLVCEIHEITRTYTTDLSEDLYNKFLELSFRKPTRVLILGPTLEGSNKMLLMLSYVENSITTSLMEPDKVEEKSPMDLDA